MTQDSVLRPAFEAWWLKRNPECRAKVGVWFKRSNLWGRGGYDQPCVHGDWEIFKAGVKWAQENPRKRKRSPTTGAVE